MHLIPFILILFIIQLKVYTRTFVWNEKKLGVHKSFWLLVLTIVHVLNNTLMQN